MVFTKVDLSFHCYKVFFLRRKLCQATSEIMAVSCLFKAIVGSPCSHDRQDQTNSVNEVQLLSCVKDKESHKFLWSFTGVTGEKELTLPRVATFTTQQGISNLTICPFHWSELSLVEDATENVQGKKLFANFRMLQIEEGKHVCVIYIFLLKDMSVLLENIPLVKFVKITPRT